MTCTPFKNSFKITSTSREMVLCLHLPSWPTDALCSTRHAIVPPTEGYEDGQGIGFSVLLEVHSRATAATATHFLHKLVSRMPFPVKAIQVDGGSEFMADFEGACQERGIKLFILPPRSPKLNGQVKRAHRTHLEEFYELYKGEWTQSSLNRALLA